MNYLNKFAFISICVCTFLALGQNNAPTKSCTGSEKCADRDHTLSHWKYIWNKKQLITDKRWSLPKFWVLCLHLSVPRIIWSTQIFFFFFFNSGIWNVTSIGYLFEKRKHIHWFCNLRVTCQSILSFCGLGGGQCLSAMGGGSSCICELGGNYSCFCGFGAPVFDVTWS